MNAKDIRSITELSNNLRRQSKSLRENSKINCYITNLLVDKAAAGLRSLIMCGKILYSQVEQLEALGFRVAYKEKKQHTVISW